MKHPYDSQCECLRCRREHGRRLQQAKADNTRRLRAGDYQPRFNNRARTAMERWARSYYETEGGCDQFNLDDR